MSKIFSKIIIMVIIINIVININVRAEDNLYIKNTKQDLLVLMLAYPEQIKTIERQDDNIYLVMKNNTKILYDDKKNKSVDDVFTDGDIQDTLYEPYPNFMIDKVIDKDPGRARCYKLLNAMYGESENEISKNVKLISTCYGNVMFNTVNNAAEELKAALLEVRDVAKSNSKIGSYVYPINGGFNYRRIQDTGLLSPHGYGIAVDLNRNDSDYWKWVDAEKGSKRIASYPKEIVAIFEKHGFVWGGKWLHFDILHFEYRPEVILKSKYFSQRYDENEKWYEGLPEDNNINEYIKIIDKVLDN